MNHHNKTAQRFYRPPEGGPLARVLTLPWHEEHDPRHEDEILLVIQSQSFGMFPWDALKPKLREWVPPADVELKIAQTLPGWRIVPP